jgi:hypothetical protein
MKMKAIWLLLAMLPPASAAPPDLNGDWRLLRPLGVWAPAGLVVKIQQTAIAVRFETRWEEPKNRQYGLTLLGIVTPNFRLSTADTEDINQVGPFVFHSHSHWEGDRLITQWRTSSFEGFSFQGTWKRYLSADGKEMIVEIAALSSEGKKSDATLLFRRP